MIVVCSGKNACSKSTVDQEFCRGTVCSVVQVEITDTVLAEPAESV